jgi:hypothetical protein
VRASERQPDGDLCQPAAGRRRLRDVIVPLSRARPRLSVDQPHLRGDPLRDRGGQLVDPGPQRGHLGGKSLDPVIHRSDRDEQLQVRGGQLGPRDGQRLDLERMRSCTGASRKLVAHYLTNTTSSDDLSERFVSIFPFPR